MVSKSKIFVQLGLTTQICLNLIDMWYTKSPTYICKEGLYTSDDSIP